METRVLNMQGEEIGKIDLPKKVFGQEINKALLWEMVTALLRHQRQGTAKAKNRAEISGGGKKPWRQKGIGWARHGSIRSPIWRKGGVVFGPKPRDYYSKIPRKKRMGALLSALSAVAKEDRILIVDELKIDEPKTRIVSSFLQKAKLMEKNILIGINEDNGNLRLAVRNISNVYLKRITDINCHDILSADYVLLTKKGLEGLEKRCAMKK